MDYGATTVTVPFIPACKVHVYGYEPTLGKERDTLVLLVVGMFPPVGTFDDVNVTLCSGAGTNVHVTVPPAAMVTEAGSKVLAAVAVTVADCGGELAAVTVTVTCANLPSEVAVTFDTPAATPVAVVDAPVVGESETLVRSDELQVTVRVRLPPCASRGCAEN